MGGGELAPSSPVDIVSIHFVIFQTKLRTIKSLNRSNVEYIIPRMICEMVNEYFRKVRLENDLSRLLSNQHTLTYCRRQSRTNN